MLEIFAVVQLVLLLAALILLVMVLRKQSGAGADPVAAIKAEQERVERAIRDEISRSRTESGTAAKQLREEVTASFKAANESLVTALGNISEVQKNQLETFSRRLAELTVTNEQRLKSMQEGMEKKLQELRGAVEQRLKEIQEDNTRKLEQMRATVDEKLQGTLEKRLGESFKQVSERLEAVYKGLGEMQNLASGVGDLKRVLTNVKTRGIWGEIQLGILLEQVLAPGQYERDFLAGTSREHVEFAIKLPGRQGDASEPVYLPIDSKFPIEDYQRLLEAQERSDAEAAQAAGADLERQAKRCAEQISFKYLNPPKTTDFGIMFLPIEGLYAEMLRRPGLIETLQRDYHVVVAGPTTLAALLNSLQMGFHTLAIQQRSSEVWGLLGEVKTEFDKFGDVLGKVQKKLQEASNTIESAAQRTRVLQRKLKQVQYLPAGETTMLPGLEATVEDMPGEPIDDEASIS